MINSSPAFLLSKIFYYLPLLLIQISITHAASDIKVECTPSFCKKYGNCFTTDEEGTGIHRFFIENNGKVLHQHFFSSGKLIASGNLVASITDTQIVIASALVGSSAGTTAGYTVTTIDRYSENATERTVLFEHPESPNSELEFNSIKSMPPAIQVEHVQRRLSSYWSTLPDKDHRRFELEYRYSSSYICRPLTDRRF